MLDDNKHFEPLEVRPALTHRLSDVQSDQGAVGDDADDGRDPEGEIPEPPMPMPVNIFNVHCIYQFN